MGQTIEPTVEATNPPAQTDGLQQNRDFWLLVVGQGTSVLGDQCWFVALPWLVLELTGSSSSAGITRALEQMPYLLFALIAGALVDRWNRRRMLLGLEVGRTLTLLFLPLMAWLGLLSAWHIFLVAFILSSLDVFFNVGIAAVLPGIVAKEHLTKANSILDSIYSLAAILGLPMIGALLGLIGAPWLLALDGLSYLVSLVAILFMRVPTPAPTGRRLSASQLGRDIGEGLRYMWQNRLMRWIAGLNFLGNFTSGTMTVLGFFYLKETLRLPGELIGIVLGLAALGTFTGAICNPRLVRRLGHGNTVLLGLGLGLLPFVIFGLSAEWLWLGLGQFVFGLALILINTNTTVIRQTTVPAQMLGRVIGSARMLAYISLPIGALVSGWLAEMWSPSGVFWLAAGIRLGLAGLTLFSPLRGYRLASKTP